MHDGFSVEGLRVHKVDGDGMSLSLRQNRDYVLVSQLPTFPMKASIRSSTDLRRWLTKVNTVAQSPLVPWRKLDLCNRPPNNIKIA